MLNYSDLSPAQKKFVDLLDTHFPQYKNQETCSFRELMDANDFFVSMREKDKRYKVSKPLWIITHNAVSRGQYKVPFETTKIEETISDPMEKMYRAELAKFGIKPKAQ